MLGKASAGSDASASVAMWGFTHVVFRHEAKPHTWAVVRGA